MVYVPGVLQCAKCKFRVVKSIININTGTVIPTDPQPEQCPNGCGPLWKVSWRQEASEILEKYEELLLAVHQKFPNETRHQTALRYIKNAENSTTNQWHDCKENPPPIGKKVLTCIAMTEWDGTKDVLTGRYSEPEVNWRGILYRAQGNKIGWATGFPTLWMEIPLTPDQFVEENSK